MLSVGAAPNGDASCFSTKKFEDPPTKFRASALSFSGIGRLSRHRRRTWKGDIIRRMTIKRMKFPIQDFPIKGTILTSAKREAAMNAALETLAAEGRLIRGKYLGCPPIKVAGTSKKR